MKPLAIAIIGFDRNAETEKLAYNQQVWSDAKILFSSGIVMNPQDLLSYFSILKDYHQDWKVEHREGAAEHRKNSSFLHQLLKK
ncbi:hypothetical protein DN062_08415 [Nitrincola tibetensis]|uniref:Uncharacterized protein n=1 Tax=Nitrincola tibetensis TaxID=2219697 RepID=A0A364NMA4_9GAMM|nr:hypothetical protein [Nitrincola tibetensis]RAU18248.1 hypothetical protein DN062_08415 [Nitrincola tibetensis]